MRSTLLAWYDQHRRRLPWRADPNTRGNPYHVLVSEIMLQQTTVATVKRRYPAFLERFPSIRAMARADIDEVLHAWQGLGYYRRARALHAAANEIVQNHAGELPSSLQSLRQLSGIGPYSAAAVAAIAFGQPVVPVDGNVTRVLARVIGLTGPVTRNKRAIDVAAGALAARERAGDFAQALMELGALVCKPLRADCRNCPWSPHCRAKAIGATDRIPVKEKKAARPTRYGTAFVARRPDGAIYFRRRPDRGLLAGMIEVPSNDWVDNPPPSDARALANPPFDGCFSLEPGEVVHVFTHFRLVLKVACGTSGEGGDGFWHAVDRLDQLALPTLTKRILRHVGVMI